MSGCLHHVVLQSVASFINRSHFAIVKAYIQMSANLIPAKLPRELYENRPRSVSDLHPGQSGHVTFTDLNVAENGECYLSAAARLRSKAGKSTVAVRRDEAGYHVVIAANTKYAPGAIRLPRETIPVASIAVGPEEE
jgi:hypothetical protein